MSARRLTASAILPSRASETLVPGVTRSRTIRRERNDDSLSWYCSRPSSRDLLRISHSWLTHFLQCSAAGRSPAISGISSSASATFWWNQSAETGPPANSRCSENNGRTHLAVYAFTSVNAAMLRARLTTTASSDSSATTPPLKAKALYLCQVCIPPPTGVAHMLREQASGQPADQRELMGSEEHPSGLE